MTLEAGFSTIHAILDMDIRARSNAHLIVCGPPLILLVGLLQCTTGNIAQLRSLASPSHLDTIKLLALTDGYAVFPIGVRTSRPLVPLLMATKDEQQMPRTIRHLTSLAKMVAIASLSSLQLHA